MYEHYCGKCARLWWDHDFEPEECPFCHAKQEVTPSEYPGFVKVVIQTSYVD